MSYWCGNQLSTRKTSSVPFVYITYKDQGFQEESVHSFSKVAAVLN